MKPSLLCALVATACLGLHDSGDRRAAVSSTAVMDRAMDYTAMLLDPMRQEWLDRRYEFVARVSTSRRCLTVTAKGEPRNLIDSLEIGLCENRGGDIPGRMTGPPAIAHIEVSTLL